MTHIVGPCAWRLWVWAEVKRRVAAGEIGGLRRTAFTATRYWRPQKYFEQAPWRATWGGEGGAVLVNQAAHQLDLWIWLCGQPTSVFANVGFGFRRDIAVEDEVAALVKFECGASGVFKPEKRLSDEVSMEIAAQIFANTVPLDSLFTTETLTSQLSHVGMLNAVLSNFAAHILHGEPLLAPGLEGAASVRLANAMRLSGWTGREVALDFDDAEYLDELNARIRAEGKYPERPS